MSVVGQCLAAFIFGSVVGFLVQRSRFCNTAALRDAMLFKTYRNTKALLVTMMILTVGFTTFMTLEMAIPYNLMWESIRLSAFSCLVSVWF